MEVNIYFEEGFENAVSEGWLKKVAETALQYESQPDAELGVVITGQEKITQLNKKYLNREGPTDVLAFALKGTPGEMPFPAPDDDVDHLGEVVISVEQAAIQAPQHHHSSSREIAVLLVHGILHLIGYDHETREDGARMRKKEAEIFSALKGYKLKR